MFAAETDLYKTDKKLVGFNTYERPYKMKCKIRKWELSDAKDLAIAVSNRKIQDNLRDGLPYPYTEQDGTDYISAMLSANEDETYAFVITADNKVVGSIGVFRRETYTDRLLN